MARRKSHVERIHLLQSNRRVSAVVPDNQDHVLPWLNRKHFTLCQETATN